ncbi:MAG: metallophosphoesterase family protein [Deltaproteobacteria bacterium]|nr:metallophosphoesterase family protein [Deltaproteobacteria bacterium]
MPLRGRGAHYSIGRRAVEWTLHNAYRGHWPARLVRALGMQRRVQVRHHRVAVAGWPSTVRPLRIAFISDLHAGPTTHSSLLDEAFAQLAAADADLVLLGGDYVFLFAEYIDAIADRLRRIRAPSGIYAVMGNHDLWADDAAIAGALEAAGARVLVNQPVSLAAPFAHVALVGLDDPWTGSVPRLPLLPRGDDRIRVVLAHAPEVMLHLGDEPFDLALCGHTHGGHVALPGGVPILVPGPLSRRYAHGRHDVGGGRTLIVSRGIGGTEVALRTFADPDILIVELGC